MSITTPNMGLIKWTLGGDPYDHSQLASNFQKVDEHDHTNGKGVRLKGGSLEPGSIGTEQLADGSVTDAKLSGGITADKFASGVLGSPGDFKWWWRPNGLTAIPSGGWVICAGQTLNSSQHEFPGGGSITVPDLIGRTVFGVLEAQIGQTGGISSITLNHNHQVEPHTHLVPQHGHPINLESGFNASTNLKVSQDLSGNAWVHSDDHSGAEHRHSINGSVGEQGPWTSGEAAPFTSEAFLSASIIPPYTGLLPLLRVKFS